MATTSLYLIPRPAPTDAAPLNNNTVGTFTSVAPTGVTILAREYGATNDLETVIKLLQGMQPELAAMTGYPVAIRIDLIAPD